MKMATSLLAITPMKLLSSVVLVGGLVMGSLAYAQDPSQTTPPREKPGDASKVSITGCLTKGAVASEYLITDQKSGEKLPFNTPAPIDKYVNQTVKLTGTIASQGQEKVFRPESINQVAATCDKGQ
jgi:hypothetical protein